MLSQAVGYAATALGYVAAAGGSPILVKEIAEASDIPGSYLAKIINVLARKGLVITQRGIGGGVILAKPPKDIAIFDLCVALDDASVQPRCMLGTSECSDQRACPAHSFWCAQRDEYLAFLKNTTVADVASFETRRRWRSAQNVTVNGAPQPAPAAHAPSEGAMSLARMREESLARQVAEVDRKLQR